MDTLHEMLLQYEKDFFSAAFCNKANLERRLAIGFYEYGTSGRIHTRNETIAALAALQQDRAIDIIDFSLQQLSCDNAMVQYRTFEYDNGRRALRTSIWCCQIGEWRILFHQGTPVADV